MDQLSQCPAYTLPAQSWRRLALNNPGRLVVVRKTQGHWVMCKLVTARRSSCRRDAAYRGGAFDAAIACFDDVIARFDGAARWFSRRSDRMPAAKERSNAHGGAMSREWRIRRWDDCLVREAL
jgi:hypothetical protein